MDPEGAVWAAGVLERRRTLSYARLKARTGVVLLDVGCGAGTDTIPLAGIVGPTGQVVGVDLDPCAIARGRAAAADHQVAAWTRHLEGDARALPFADGEFDGVRCVRLLLHVARPQQVVDEMVRVTKPGGAVVLMDTDLTAMVIAGMTAELDYRLRQAVSKLVENAEAGRELLARAVRAGLPHVTVDLLPFPITSLSWARAGTLMEAAERRALEVGLVSASEIRRCRAELERRDRAGEFFAWTLEVLVAGEKPGSDPA